MAINKDESYAGLCEKWVEDYLGVSIQGDTAYDSWQTFAKNGKAVQGVNGIKPGDLVYFSSSPSSPYGTDGHVGIYTGNGNFMSASDTGVTESGIGSWAKTNNQQILGYVPQNNLQSDQQGRGAGMAGVDPQTLYWGKMNGQYQQFTAAELQDAGVSDLSQYKTVADNPNPPSGSSTTSSSAPTGGGIAGSGVSANQLVGNAVAGENAGNVQKQNEAAASANAPTISGQQVSMNANDIAKQSIELQEEAFNKDKTLAPEVLNIDLAPKNGKPGMTLQSAMAKYGAYMDPASIFSQYNEVNGTGQPGTWGPATNSVAQLQSMGFNDIPQAIQDKQNTINAINLVRSLRSAWNNYVKNPSDQNAKGEYVSVKNTLTDPSSNYGKLVAQYRGSFPSPTDVTNPETWLNSLTGMGSEGKFKGVEDEIIAQSGGQSYKSLGLNNPYGQTAQTNNGQEQLNPNLAENAVNDASQMGTGVLDTLQQGAPSTHMKNGKPTDVANAKAAATGVIRDLGQTFGIIPGKNGKLQFDPKEALVHDYNHPLSTISWIAPFLKGGKLVEEAGEVGKATKAAEGTRDIVQANKAQKLISRGTDLARGKGSKAYVSRNAETGISQNQILNDENILSHPTTSGKIEATQRSINKYGRQIGSLYENSNKTFASNELSDTLDKELQKEGYDQKTIDFMKRYISRNGDFNLSTGETGGKAYGGQPAKDVSSEFKNRTVKFDKRTKPGNIKVAPSSQTIKEAENATIKGTKSKKPLMVPRYETRTGVKAGTGNTTISAKQAWDAAKKLEEAPPKMLKNPESMAAYTKLSKTTAKIIRQKLGEKLPESKVLNKKYETLKDFHDSLKEPTGIQSRGGLFSTATGLAQDATETPLNWLYKAAGLKAPTGAVAKTAATTNKLRKMFPYYYAASDLSKSLQQNQ